MLNEAGGRGFQVLSKFFDFFRRAYGNRGRLPAVEQVKGDEKVPKPPVSPPSSDIDGVHEDEKRNPESARRSGQDTSDLARARDEAAARPAFSDDDAGRDDRAG